MQALVSQFSERKCRNGIRETQQDLSVPTSDDILQHVSSKKLKRKIPSGVKNSRIKTTDINHDIKNNTTLD